MKKGQSSIEYLIIMVIVMAALLATGFIGNMRGHFEDYFNHVKGKLVNP